MFSLLFNIPMWVKSFMKNFWELISYWEFRIWLIGSNFIVGFSNEKSISIELEKKGDFIWYIPPITNSGLKFSLLPLISLYKYLVASKIRFILFIFSSLLRFMLKFSSTPILSKSIVRVYLYKFKAVSMLAKLGLSLTLFYFFKTYSYIWT